MGEETGGEQVAPKKNKSTKVIVIVIVVLAVLSVGGYFTSRYFSGKIAEKATESLLGSAINGNVDVTDDGQGVSVSNENGSAQYGSSAQWPSDMPSVVPEFTYGDISMATKDSSNSSWSVYYEQVQSGAIDSYKSDLSSRGWVNNSETTAEDGQYIQMVNGDYGIMIIYDSSTSSASIIVSTSSSSS